MENPFYAINVPPMITSKTVKGEYNNAMINMAAATKQSNSIDPCRPSRKSTRIKLLYTRADPVSFCNMINPAGRARITPIVTRLEKRITLKLWRLMT